MSVPPVQFTVDTSLCMLVTPVQFTVDTALYTLVPPVQFTVDTVLYTLVPPVQFTVDTALYMSVPPVQFTVDTALYMSVPPVQFTVDTALCILLSHTSCSCLSLSTFSRRNLPQALSPHHFATLFSSPAQLLLPATQSVLTLTARHQQTALSLLYTSFQTFCD
jgi:hypothetical protein